MSTLEAIWVYSTQLLLFSTFYSASFPSGTKQLEKDTGLFQGPRPGVCHNVGYKKIAALFKGKLEAAIVLTHDNSAAR
jgi:hypothetical protein